MTNYVLVHGGDRDGSIWDETANLLQSQGHRVFCPSMTSVTKATLQENINEVIDYIHAKQLDHFILVGHSYGSVVITGVTDQLSEQVSALIYVDSTIPKENQSLYDITVEYGFDLKEYGLTEDPAVMSPCHFDAKRVYSRPKAYIFCLQSEFIELTKPIYEETKKSNDDWLYFCLDTEHGCMFTQAKELAVIFSGMGIFA